MSQNSFIYPISNFYWFKIFCEQYGHEPRLSSYKTKRLQGSEKDEPH